MRYRHDFQGWSINMFQASQQWSTISSKVLKTRFDDQFCRVNSDELSVDLRELKIELADLRLEAAKYRRQLFRGGNDVILLPKER
jgi:hypothetical protein